MKIIYGLVGLVSMLMITQPQSVSGGSVDQSGRFYYPPNHAYESHGRNITVRRVQLALQAAGYYTADNRGDYCSETRTAVRRYQRDKGLPMTNRIDDATLRSLGLL